MEKKRIIDIVEKKEDCCGCHACFNACPVQAIEMHLDEEGFLYPVILRDICIQCNKCKKVCPVLHQQNSSSLQIAYGCYAIKEEEHMTSSSGGAFSVFARMVIADNGLVCGAAYNEKQEVCHLIIDAEENIYQLKETKYVQSTIGIVYQKIKNSLEQQRQVLFSGTPCQVAGLKGYLGKDYDNLLCVDLICHGVPSPEVWKRYLNEISQGKQITKVSFRNKKQGMSKVTIDYIFDDGSIVKENYKESPYIKGFLQNLYVRPSCFECKFKGMNRCSDLTIGDFWSINEYHPGFDDEKGVSAVIIHSKKGAMWFERARNSLNIVEATIEEIACWNDNLLTSTKKNPKRKDFYENWNTWNLKELITFHTKDLKSNNSISILSKVKCYIKKWL